MGELARRRQARDLWISHSHLRAGGVAGAFMLVAAFAAGASTGSREVIAAEPPGWLDQAADTELVELLARVDAAAEPDGGLSRLTFPTALAQDEAIPPAPPFGDMPQPATHVATAGAGLSDASPLPEGWAVVIDDLDGARARLVADRLAAAGVEDVRIDERLIEGRRAIRVGIGGLDSQTDAQAVLIRVRQAPVDDAANARIVEISGE